MILSSIDGNKVITKRNVKGGFKTCSRTKMYYSTNLDDLTYNTNTVLMNDIIESEKSMTEYGVVEKYKKLYEEISRLIVNRPFDLIVRRKVETLYVDGQLGTTCKYEFKLSLNINQKKCIVCCGGTGSFYDVLLHSEFKKNILKKMALYTMPMINYKSVHKQYVLLSNQATGFLCHEAIGHMAESDMIGENSAFYDKLGKKLFDQRISIVDDGNVAFGAGNICFDEEGTTPSRNYIIKEGVLNTYLTNEFYASKYGIKNTGNLRSSIWNQPSMIRMTNTFMLDGSENVKDIIKKVKEGIYINDVLSGNCYNNGDVKLYSNEASLIRNGVVVGRLENVTLEDNVFELFNNVIMIGDDSKLCLGSSSCGKGGSIKVDAGGPHVLLNAKVNVGYEYR